MRRTAIRLSELVVFARHHEDGGTVYRPMCRMLDEEDKSRVPEGRREIVAEEPNGRSVNSPAVPLVHIPSAPIVVESGPYTRIVRPDTDVSRPSGARPVRHLRPDQHAVGDARQIVDELRGVARGDRGLLKRARGRRRARRRRRRSRKNPHTGGEPSRARDAAFTTRLRIHAARRPSIPMTSLAPLSRRSWYGRPRRSRAQGFGVLHASDRFKIPEESPVVDQVE